MIQTAQVDQPGSMMLRPGRSRHLRECPTQSQAPVGDGRAALAGIATP